MKKLITIIFACLSLISQSKGEIVSGNACNGSWVVSPYIPNYLDQSQCYWVASNNWLNIDHAAAIYSTLDGYCERWLTFYDNVATGSTLQTACNTNIPYGTPSERDIERYGTHLVLDPNKHASAMNKVWNEFNSSVGIPHKHWLLPKTGMLPTLDWYEIKVGTNYTANPFTHEVIKGRLSSPEDMSVDDVVLQKPAYTVLKHVLNDAGFTQPHGGGYTNMTINPNWVTNKERLDNKLNPDGWSMRSWCDLLDENPYVVEVLSPQWLDQRPFNNASRRLLPLLGEIAMPLELSQQAIWYMQSNFTHEHIVVRESRKFTLPTQMSVIDGVQVFALPSGSIGQPSIKSNIVNDVEGYSLGTTSPYAYVSDASSSAIGGYVVEARMYFTSTYSLNGLVNDPTHCIMIDLTQNAVLDAAHPNILFADAYEASYDGQTYQTYRQLPTQQGMGHTYQAGFNLMYQGQSYLRDTIKRSGEYAKTTEIIYEDYSSMNQPFAPWQQEVGEEATLMYVDLMEKQQKDEIEGQKRQQWHTSVNMGNFNNPTASRQGLESQIRSHAESLMTKANSTTITPENIYPVTGDAASSTWTKTCQRMMPIGWQSWTLNYTKLFFDIDENGNLTGSGKGITGSGTWVNIRVPTSQASQFWVANVSGHNAVSLPNYFDDQVGWTTWVYNKSLWLYKTYDWNNYTDDGE